LVALVVLAGALVGCGDDREQVQAAVVDLQRAFVAGDLDRVCALLTPDARRHVGAIAHDVGLDPRDRTPCRADLRIVVERARRSPDWRARARRAVGDVHVDGDSATATVTLGDGAESTVPLARVDGVWRVDAIYGDIPAGRVKDRF
jgi:ketosteroid isomerase-like protein